MLQEALKELEDAKTVHARLGAVTELGMRIVQLGQTRLNEAAEDKLKAEAKLRVIQRPCFTS